MRRRCRSPNGITRARHSSLIDHTNLIRVRVGVSCQLHRRQTVRRKPFELHTCAPQYSRRRRTLRLRPIGWRAQCELRNRVSAISSHASDSYRPRSPFRRSAIRGARMPITRETRSGESVPAQAARLLLRTTSETSACRLCHDEPYRFLIMIMTGLMRRPSIAQSGPSRCSHFVIPLNERHQQRVLAAWVPITIAGAHTRVLALGFRIHPRRGGSRATRHTLLPGSSSRRPSNSRRSPSRVSSSTPRRVIFLRSTS